MRTTVGFLSLILFSRLFAADGEMRGRLLERVVCAADSSQTYALYVPSNYSAKARVPVIYCFDPGARGRVPVARLQAAAEKYGFIVAGSNNSRNGPWADNARAIEAMVKDVITHLATDPRRVYSAGLSGGARVATQIALEGYSKGVIACSAGFPESAVNIPARVDFPFFGTAGVEDMNYREMRQLDEDLESRRAAHRIVNFDGGHEWAPEALMMEAVEWLEVQAMRGGTRVKDTALIEAIWRERLAGVPAAPGLDRWKALKSLAADFKGLRATETVEAEAKQLGAARETKEALKAERALVTKENALYDAVAAAATGGAGPKQKFAEELRERANAAEDSPDRRMVRRVVAGFASTVRENVRGLFESGDYSGAADVLEMAVALRPGQSRTLYDLAFARAHLRDPKKALGSLYQAATLGFSDAERVESEPAFAKFKTDPVFQEIVAKIRANPPEPDRRGGDGRPRTAN